MEYGVIVLASLLTAALTLFSGFGLGTILMPVFAIFFPIEAAIAVTAVVHLANNVFNLGLLGRMADRTTVLIFGLPAIPASFLGAYALQHLTILNPLAVYQLFGRYFEVIPVKLIMAVLIAVFALIEVLPEFRKLSFGKKYIPLGGLLSGFFGGLSGHQGAFRSAFLLRSGISKEQFIASGVVIAMMVDVPRITVYAGHFAEIRQNIPLLATAAASAFLGSYLGSRFIGKIEMKSIEMFVSLMLFGIAAALGLGMI